jgi:FkbH-like protein
MNPLYAELQWLPRAPGDFSQRLKALADSPGPLGGELRSLASRALDLNQLTKLAKAMGKACAEGKPLNPLTPFRLAVLSNSTIDLIVPALVASAARHGIALEVIQPSYDQVAQEALTPDSKVNSQKPDAVLFALDYRALPLKLSLGDAEASSATVQGVIGYLKALSNGIKTHSNAVCIFQTLAPPVETLFGSLDRAVPGTLRSLIEGINRELTEFVLGSGDVLFDVAGLAETVGLADWHDTQLWNLGKFSFSDEFVPLYADHVARTVAAIRGKSRRVLILDLDNTVWGGVIGDDGLEGINIAQGDATGEAYLAVQRMALALRRRGVVLAVSSKNTDEVARTPFLKHPEMLLKLDHIAVFQANWNDKATNIMAIAEELSLGLESMVFLDDNPMERDIVRQMLPLVAVPELPAEPALYARTLAAAGYFEAIRFSKEDLTRADFYQDNSRRIALQQQVGDLDSYLASLEMEITFAPFDETGRTRIAQLISKSNQFNLTTRRYSEAEVAQIQQDPSCFSLQARLQDVFGDNGMISVIICRHVDRDTLEFDTWLMSCRVLGRRVEEVTLDEVISYAAQQGYRKLIGRYIPTERNALVKDHYEKLGFEKIRSLESGETVWQLDLQTASPSDVPMQVRRLGYELTSII